MADKNGTTAKSGSPAHLGFEAKLWAAADALRNNMDAAEYERVVLGLISPKCISVAFEAKHAELVAQRAQVADPDDPVEYRADGCLFPAALAKPTPCHPRETL
jgi:type I restriction enzyme M protein